MARNRSSSRLERLRQMTPHKSMSLPQPFFGETEQRRKPSQLAVPKENLKKEANGATGIGVIKQGGNRNEGLENKPWTKWAKGRANIVPIGGQMKGKIRRAV